MKKILMSTFGAIVLMSCSTMSKSKSKVGTEQASISNTKWTLVEPMNGKKPTLLIEMTNVSGNAGCNNYSGVVNSETATGSFSAKNLISTKMACPNLETEDNYMKLLQEANKYVLIDNVLELYKDKLLLLKFNKIQ